MSGQSLKEFMDTFAVSPRKPRSTCEREVPNRSMGEVEDWRQYRLPINLGAELNNIQLEIRHHNAVLDRVDAWRKTL